MDGPVTEHPLSPAQQGMWLLERMSRTAVYVDPMTFRLTGRLDVEALHRSLDELVRRHDALRTTFPMVDRLPVQRVGPDGAVKVAQVDLSALAPEQRAAELTALLDADTGRRFDLADGPVMRALLVRLGAGEHVFRMTVHHIVFDAWSWWSVLLRELEVLYAAELEHRANPLPPPAGQFPDFVRWQREWCAGPAYQRQLAYWRDRLAGVDALPALALPGPAEPIPGRSPATLWATVPGPVHAALKDLARRERVTMFMLLLAAFTVVLHRQTGAEDIAIGTRAAVRTRPEYQDAVGFFVNLLVLRTRLDPAGTFRQLLRDVRTTALGAYAHREIPFEKLVEELRPARRRGFHTLVNVVFTVQSTAEQPPRLPGVEAVLLNHDPQTLYDLDLVFFEERGDLRALFTYDRGRVGDAAAADLLAAVIDVLAAVAEDPATTLEVAHDAG